MPPFHYLATIWISQATEVFVSEEIQSRLKHGMTSRRISRRQHHSIS